jgi:hypothetical protein
MHRIKSLHIWALAVLLAVISGLAAFNTAYQRTGRTPGELMTYAERRMAGHPKLQFVVLPFFELIRTCLDEPSIPARHKIPFYVPIPPDLQQNGAATFTHAEPSPDPKVIRVGPYENIKSIDAAAHTAVDGDIIEIRSAEYHADVTIWHQKKLTIRGIEGHARLIADGKIAEGKAIWVIRSGDFTIENIDFIGARAVDNNGAGIRFEDGTLHIRNCLFYGNQEGIMTNSARNASLQIEDSEFAYNGYGDGYTHGIYAGAIDTLKVTGSYFHHANVGHLLKSRARNNYIANNRLTDEKTGRGSYELNFPNGGIVKLVGNIVEQSRMTENSTLVSFGEEGYLWPQNQLYLINNTLVNDHPYGGSFLRVTKGAGFVISNNNLLVGIGQYHLQDVLIANNDIKIGKEAFVNIQTYDYHLTEAGKKQAELTIANNTQQSDDSLRLTQQYQYPASTTELVGGIRYAGALQ